MLSFKFGILFEIFYGVKSYLDKLIKQLSYFFLSLGLLILFFSTSNSLTNSSGSPSGFTGSPGDDLQSCTSCHGISSTQTPLPYSLSINTDIVEYYVPGDMYHITIDVLGPGIDKFGFQTCFENEEGEKVGEIILSDSLQTQLISSGNYITHTSNGVDGLGFKSWDFYWEAPINVQGEISVYTSVLLSGNNIVGVDDYVLSTSQSFSQPILGCLDSEASNFNEQANIDDASCLYESFSSASFLSLSYDSLIINGDILDQELEVNFTIYNNSDSDLDVYVLRNILTDNVPENWFCWDLCYLPNTDISSYSSVIPAGSYSNEFSAHLVPQMSGGFYDIEYCFFSDMNYSDSICATVHYVVEGDIPGCTNLNALNYDDNANVDNGACVLYPMPDWDFSFTSSTSHSILISTDTEIEINDESINSGDFIGLFYETSEGFVCVAYHEWQNQNVNFIAPYYADVFEADFFIDTGFVWKIWDASSGIVWPMEVSYNPNFSSSGWFEENGQSGLLSMHNINPITLQQIDLPIGWSMFSSHIITEDMDVITFIEPISDNVIIVKNGQGAAYLVEYQFNAIGDLEVGQGYIVKTTQACNIAVEGVFAKGELHPILLESGWNMIGYLREDPEPVEVIFNDLVTQGAIRLVKDYEGNIYLPEWTFNAIGNMEPGRGYQVKTFNECVLQY